MSDAPSAAGPSTVIVRLREIASFVAPTTVATALLFYFGYVATRARFEYFGIYLDMTDLSNQSMLLYGLEVIYVPAALAFLAALAVVAAHATVRWLLADPRRDQINRLVALGIGLAGLLLIGRALIGMLVGGVEGREFPGTTALALAAGPALLAYAVWIAGRVASRPDGAGDPGGRLTAWWVGDRATGLRRSALACVIGLAVAGSFWAANEFAWAYGGGRAYEDAVKMPERPGVVLDTREQLASPPQGVRERSLPGSPSSNGSFHYRYEGLRLLLASGGRLFLVPENWRADSRTMVVSYDADIRVQLIPGG